MKAPRVDVTSRRRLPGVRTACLRRAVRRLLAEEGCALDVSIVIVDDAEIARLHETYLGEKGPTDVITFPLRDETDPDPLLGEVVLSAETALREARARGIDPGDEVVLYAVHGTLHLLGYDDLEPRARRRMKARQDAFMKSRRLDASSRS